MPAQTQESLFPSRPLSPPCLAELEEARRETQQRPRFEHTLAEVALAFVMRGFDEAVQVTLETLAEQTGASRAYLFLLRDEGAVMDNTHEHCAPGVSPQRESLQGLPCSLVSWWMERLHRHQAIHIPDVAVLPPEAASERDLLEAQDIRSLLVLPLVTDRALAGFMGLDNVTDTGAWSDHDVALLRVASDVVGNALARHRAEQALMRSNAKLQVLWEHAPYAAFLHDLSGRIVDCNDAGQQMLGRSRAEVLGTNSLDRDILPAEQRALLVAELLRLGAGEPGRAFELVVPREDGVVTLELQGHLVTLDEGPRVLALARDITRQRSLEAQVHQAQKMEAVGTLAGGVAHDLNNVLSTILAVATAVEQDLGADHRCAEDLRSIIETCLRGGEVARNLLGFSRRDRPARRRVALNHEIATVCRFLAHTLPRNVDIERRLDEALGDVDGDPGQLDHVLLNLCINAADAMPAGGRLAIRSRNLWLEPADLPAGAAMRPGAYVRIEVEDTGVGMEPAVLARCVEPFFTTKEKGSGLGLAMAYNTIQNHGGRVLLHSRPGRGTTVTLDLPASSASPLRLVAPESRASASDLTARTVLIVDDEALLRKAAARLLRRLGCEVVEAADGKEALRIADAKRGAISLAVLDLDMPVMDGVETFQHLRQRHPELPILLSTGHGTGDDRLRVLLTQPRCGVIAKPHSLDEFREAILGLLA